MATQQRGQAAAALRATGRGLGWFGRRVAQFMVVFSGASSGRPPIISQMADPNYRKPRTGAQRNSERHNGEKRADDWPPRG